MVVLRPPKNLSFRTTDKQPISLFSDIVWSISFSMLLWKRTFDEFYASCIIFCSRFNKRNDVLKKILYENLPIPIPFNSLQPGREGGKKHGIVLCTTSFARPRSKTLIQLPRLRGSSERGFPLVWECCISYLVLAEHSSPGQYFKEYSYRQLINETGWMAAVKALDCTKHET